MQIEILFSCRTENVFLAGSTVGFINRRIKYSKVIQSQTLGTLFNEEKKLIVFFFERKKSVDRVMSWELRDKRLFKQVCEFVRICVFYARFN